MAGLPGSIPSLIPAGQDEQVRRMRDVERRLDELGPSVARSFKPVIDALQAQVAATAAATAAVAAAQITLTAQQATLTAQQADLAAQNTQILALIGQQVTSAVPGAPGTGSGFNVGTSQGTKASTTIAVPAGFSQALVFATGTLTMQDTSANRFDTRCGIAGNYGVALPNLAMPVGCTAIAHSLTLTGLAGGTILLEVQALAAVSATNTSNTAIVTGFAIFFR